MPKITIPIFEEEDSDVVIKNIKQFGEIALKIKTFYPSVWSAICSQYKLEYSRGIVSDDLFEKKLEILLMQDEELRNK